MPDIILKTTLPEQAQMLAEQAQMLADLHHESFPEAPWSTEQITASLALPTTQGWTAFIGGACVGFLLCQIAPPQSEILTFCVRPSFRRQGVAENLLQATIEANRLKGSDSLFLEVAANNHPARALYEKCGFKQTGKRPNYYVRGAQKIDAILLTLTINAASFASHA